MKTILLLLAGFGVLPACPSFADTPDAWEMYHPQNTKDPAPRGFLIETKTGKDLAVELVTAGFAIPNGPKIMPPNGQTQDEYGTRLTTTMPPVRRTAGR